MIFLNFCELSSSGTIYAPLGAYYHIAVDSWARGDYWTRKNVETRDATVSKIPTLDLLYILPPLIMMLWVHVQLVICEYS